MGNTALTQVILRAVQLAVNAILARELTPTDYGIVAFANVILELLYHMNSLGLSTALIQVDPLRQETKDTSATLNVLLGIVAFLLAQACAPLAGVLLDSHDSVAVVRTLAFAFLLYPLGFLQVSLLTREMRFGSLRKAQVSGTMVRAVVSVGMALTGWKYWSLAIGHLAGTVCQSLILVMSYPIRWKPSLDRAEVRRLLGIGIPLTVAALVTFGLMRADSLVIGTMLGQDTLGYYSVAFTWSTIVCLLLAEVVHQVLLPHFARMQSDPAALRAGLLRALAPVAIIASLMAASLFAVTDWFLIDVLGKGTDRWLPAGDVMRVLCVYSVLRAVTETLDSPVLALGDTKVFMKSNLFAAIIEIALLPLVIAWAGVFGAGLVVSVAYATQWLIFVPYLRARLNVTLRDLWRALAPVVAAACAAIALGSLVPMDTEAQRLCAAARVTVVCTTMLAVHELLTRGLLLAEVRAVLRALRAPEAPAA
jgi:PST family polysaccharide transporter